MANASLTALRSDPVLNHNFVIQLIESSGTPSLGAAVDFAGSLVGGFSECTGIEMSMKIEEFSEANVRFRTDHRADASIHIYQ